MLEVKLDSKEVMKYLHKLDDKLIINSNNQIKKLTKTGLNIAKSLAPIDTGELRENIISNYYKSGNSYIGIIESKPIDGISYNIYQEFGIGQSGANNKIHPRAKSTFKNPIEGVSYSDELLGFGAQPFIYPTYVYLTKTFVDNIDDAINEVMR